MSNQPQLFKIQSDVTEHRTETLGSNLAEQTMVKSKTLGSRHSLTNTWSIETKIRRLLAEQAAGRDGITALRLDDVQNEVIALNISQNYSSH